MTQLDVANLTVAVADVALVRDVSLRIRASQALTLLGDTGSGKSLLAQAIMGTLPPELRAAGRVAIMGTEYDAADRTARRAQWGHTVALLPQEPWTSLDPTMRSLPQVSESYKHVRGVDGGWPSARRQAARDLSALGLPDANRKYPFMLSGGMAQRVAFAAAVAGGATLLIADEPTKGLDPERRTHVIAVLRSILETGGSLLTITHDVAIARALGGTVAIMLEGAIVEQGPAETVLSQPQHEYTRRLLASDPDTWHTRGASGSSQLVLTGRGLSKRFGARTLFTDVSIDVHAGERIALTGPSGSGKTTLGGILLGLVAPDRGVVTRTTAGQAWEYQKLYQDPVSSFAPHLTIRRALLDVVARHGRGWVAVERLLRRVRLGPELLDRRPDQVSGGELQRFALVRVLLVDPVLLFADEPTSRLDPITQQEILELLVETTEERGCALVLVTHDARVADALCSKTIALAETADDEDEEPLRP